MNEKLKELLIKFNDYYKERNPREKIILGFLPIIILPYLSYEFLLPKAYTYYESKKLAKMLTEDKISEASLFLLKQEQLKHQKEDLEALMALLREKKDYSMMIDNTLQTNLDYTTYNDKRWAILVNSISTKARLNGVKVININTSIPTIDINVTSNDKNTSVTTQQTVQSPIIPVMNINLTIDGDYANIIRFMGELEKEEMLISITNIVIRAEKELTADITITVYGVKV